jgi:hypothetical protein
MNALGRMTTALAVAAVAAVAGCSSAGSDVPEAPPPVTLTDVGHEGLKQVTLTDAAAQRLAVETDVVAAASTGPAGARLALPYAAVVYAGDGSTWTYVTVGRNSYVREAITVVSVAGSTATLSAGPTPGTEVVVVGAPELMGAELEISGEE